MDLINEHWTRKLFESMAKPCKYCDKYFNKLKRYCTAKTHGECDCPKCLGMCQCDPIDESINEATLLKDVKTKKGEFHPKGKGIDKVVFPQEHHGQLARLEFEDGQTMLVKSANLYLYTSQFKKPPSLNTLMKWSNDGVARSMGGARVEPDGWDSKGTPSWLLVLGVI